MKSTYEFELDNNQQKKAKDIGRFDDQKEDEMDDRMTFSKEIIEIVLNDLKVDKIEKEKLEQIDGKVHDVMNQFQNISYTKGFKAAKP